MRSNQSTRPNQTLHWDPCLSDLFRVELGFMVKGARFLFIRGCGWEIVLPVSGCQPVLWFVQAFMHQTFRREELAATRLLPVDTMSYGAHCPPEPMAPGRAGEGGSLPRLASEHEVRTRKAHGCSEGVRIGAAMDTNSPPEKAVGPASFLGTGAAPSAIWLIPRRPLERSGSSRWQETANTFRGGLAGLLASTRGGGGRPPSVTSETASGASGRLRDSADDGPTPKPSGPKPHPASTSV